MTELRPKPSFKDWTLVAIASAFVVMGFIILPKSPDVGVVTLAFFGSCLAVFIAQIVQKTRDRAFDALDVKVQGGVPIRPKKGLTLLLGVWLFALGLILFVFGSTYPMLFRALALFVVCVGAVVTVGTLMGKIPGGMLQFDPDALTIGHKKWRAKIPWDAIDGAIEAELSGNPVLPISVLDPSAIVVDPPEALPNVMTVFGKNRGWLDADFTVMATHFGLSLPVLAQAIARYIHEPSARSELTKVIGAPQISK